MRNVHHHQRTGALLLTGLTLLLAVFANRASAAQQHFGDQGSPDWQHHHSVPQPPLVVNPVQAAWSGFEQTIAKETSLAESQPFSAGAELQVDAKNFVNYTAQYLLENQLGRLDPDHPLLWRNPDPFAIPGQDFGAPGGFFNPDNLNYNAVIAPGGTYELRGVRGNSVDGSVQILSGFLGDGGYPTPTATLDIHETKIKANGTFTINIGPTPQGEN